MLTLKKGDELRTLQPTVGEAVKPLQHFLLQTGDHTLHHVTAISMRSPAFGCVFVVLTHCVCVCVSGGVEWRDRVAWYLGFNPWQQRVAFCGQISKRKTKKLPGILVWADVCTR